MLVASATENNVTNFMRPIYILHNHMFYDVITHQTMSELHLFSDLTHHVLVSCT